MDFWVILLIALAVIIVIAAVFALVRRRQRAGSVLASTGRSNNDAGAPR